MQDLLQMFVDLCEDKQGGLIMSVDYESQVWAGCDNCNYYEALS